MVLTVTSAALENGIIPVRHSCQGENMSTPLAWAGAPATTKSFALIVDDPDAGSFVHWAVFDLAGAAR